MKLKLLFKSQYTFFANLSSANLNKPRASFMRWWRHSGNTKLNINFSFQSSP